MSSLIGHTLAGASIYLSCNRPADQRAARALPVFVLLAICPDFDYFILWLFHYQTVPRLTHTLLFCLATSSMAWWCAAPLRRNNVANTPFWAMALASCSHPLLDLLVGVHPLPLLWPLPDPDIALPFGILPSAADSG
ncbi:metal-dependent hydrolase [Desulfobulbus sp.]|uniref:metal-dependent hydrolase n=1 Tax=Desulfobulbus sp. TaxID=895 RepID=UPI00286F41DE|nr:metal-dependent hydrolase [Desulfobulbus sp.]